MTWAPGHYIAKAKCYVERGLAEDPETATRAWWFHFAVEPLLRAAVAHRHPVLLADPRSLDGLLASVGEPPLGSNTPRSRSLAELLSTVIPKCVPGFDSSMAARAAVLIGRRNEECHGPAAALEDLRDDAWMADFLRVTHLICDFLEVPLEDVVGDGLAAHTRDIAAEDEATTKRTVGNLIADARARFSGPGVVSYAGIVAMVHDGGTMSHAIDCPACQETALVSGRALHVGPQRFDEGALTRAVTVGASRLHCEHCGLQLNGSAQIAAAGLERTFQLTEDVDPWNALSLDVVDEAERMGLVIMDPEDAYGYQDE